MRRSDGHHDNLIQWLQQPDTVDDACREDVKARHRRIDHGLNGFFGHARIVLKLQGSDLVTLVAVAHRADKTTHRTDALVALAKRGNFGGKIEIFCLNGDAGEHLSLR